MSTPTKAEPTPPTSPVAAVRDPRLSGPPRTVGAFAARVRRRVRGGELGAWPVIFGLILIGVIFQSLNDRFLSAQNLSNLSVQMAARGCIAVGLVLVLLLGEIDLSAGAVSGAAGATVAVLTVGHGLPDWLGILGALGLGAAIGALQGGIFARLGVPSFVVTLAGSIGWTGLLLWILGSAGTVNIPYDGFIGKITHTNLSRASGWVLGVVLVLLYLAAVLVDRRRRLSVGLFSRSPVAIAVRVGGLAVLIGITLAILNDYQGVPVALLVFVGLVVGFDLILRRTRYGRSIFAVGGNVEAARRAGINVTAIRVSAFTLCSTLAALGGVMFASRSYAASQTAGGSDTLLLAIAAAVIGGTSLFGGRGSTYSALLGALVLGAIESGMLLLSMGTAPRFMITASVLLAAVILDSLSRRGRQASGRE